MISKPDPVDQPERTAHYDCAMCTAEMLHNTIALRQCSVNIPLPPDQHHCSDEAKWRLGGGLCLQNIPQVRTQKSVNIWRNCGQEYSVSFFLTHGVYTYI